MYLYIDNDGEMMQVAGEPDKEVLERVNDGDLILLRWSGKCFERAEVESEDIPDDENSEEGDTHEELSITGWLRV